MADSIEARPDYLPPGGPPANEGKTPAAWVTVGFLSLGSLVLAVGMILESVPAIVAGAVVIIGSLVVGKVLQAMGFGQPRGPVTTTSTSRS